MRDDILKKWYLRLVIKGKDAKNIRKNKEKMQKRIIENSKKMKKLYKLKML